MRKLLYIFLFILCVQNVFAGSKMDTQSSNAVIEYHPKICNRTGKTLAAVEVHALSGNDSYNFTAVNLEHTACSDTRPAYAVSGVNDNYVAIILSREGKKYIFGLKQCNVYEGDPPIELYVFAENYGIGEPYMLEIRQVGSDNHCFAYLD